MGGIWGARRLRCGRTGGVEHRRDTGHRPGVRHGAILNPVVKRFLQTVSLALAAFLAVQPALAAINCAQMLCADGHSSMDCCLPSSGASMQRMANHDSMLSMQGAATESDCLLALCCTVSAHSTTLPAASVRSRFDGAVPIARLGGVVVAAVPEHRAATPGEASFSPGDRHTLFQVFRI